MTDTAEQFSMSMYPSAIERSAAMLEEIDRLRAELAALAETGPPMSRGTNADGTPKMGTMRDVLLDYMQAAEAEAGEADKLRAEVAGLREDAERYRTSLVRLKMQLDQQREYHAAELADVTAELEQARKAAP